MHIALVVTGAPLAGHCHRLVDGLVDDGHQLSVVASTSARSWTGDISPEHTPQGRIRPDAVICCPATFHTLNAWAAGLNDTPVLRLLNDAIGLPSPVLAVPMLADRLARHPVWPATLQTLTTGRVDLMDPHTGNLTTEPAPIVSGTGDQVADHFDPAWLLTWLHAQHPASA